MERGRHTLYHGKMTVGKKYNERRGRDFRRQRKTFPRLAMQNLSNSSASSHPTLLSTAEGRKRFRSPSMESTTSASSRKRSASEDPTASSPVTRSTRLDDTAPSLSDPTPSDIDAYMDAQGEPDVLQSTLLPAPPQVNPSDDDSPPQDIPSITFLRFHAVETMRGMPLVEGATWVLLSKPWYRRFEKAATGQVDKEGGVKEEDLGPVDNSPLLETDESLKENILEGIDFECVPEVVWGWLTDLYVLPHRFVLFNSPAEHTDMARQRKIPLEER